MRVSAATVGIRKDGTRNQGVELTMTGRVVVRRLAAGRFHYAWWVVGVTFATLVVSAGVRSAPGVLIVPLEHDLGWSRAGISFAISIGLLLYGLSGPFAGQLMDRVGSRRVMMAGLLITGSSIAFSVAMTELWQLDLIWGLLSGIGTGMTASVLGVSVANRWFAVRRGLVMGLFGSAGSAGQLVFLPFLMWLVVSTGWRGAVLSLSGALLLVFLLAALLMRSDPADVASLPYGATDSQGSGGRADGSLWQVTGRAVRLPDFWILAGTFFVCGSTSAGLIGTHLIAHSIDHGIPEITAAGTLALMGSMNFIGTLGSGYLSDRFDPRKLLAVYYTLRGLSLFLLPFVTDMPGLAIFAVVYGLDFMATVPPTAMLSADLLGRRNAGTVFGWVFFAHQVGAASAAYLSGVARTTMGDYTIPFMTGGALALLGGMLALRARARGEINAVAAPSAGGGQ